MNANLLGLLAVALVVGTAVLWFQRARRVALPENRSLWVAAFVGGALLGAVALYQGPAWPIGVAAGLTTFAGAFLVFTVAISAQKVGSDAIRVGDALPSFTAVDENGETFDSQSLAGHPVLIKFFRGHW